MSSVFRKSSYWALTRLNQLICRVMYQVSPLEKQPLPKEGPVLLVCNHASLGDPLVLLATARRPISFLMAREIYAQPYLRWMFEALHCIPVRRGVRDVGAV